jgi:hypothetical protein
VSPSNLSDIPHRLFEDDTLPDMRNLHPYTILFLTALGVREKTRMIHKSTYPLCTFAYGVTRSSAEKLLNEIAKPRPDNKDYIAFDVAVLRACTWHGLRCWSANPELFHHKMGKSLIGLNDKGEKFLPPVDSSGLPQVKMRNESSNIDCGFYSGDFTFEDGTEEGNKKLEYFRKMVREGRCDKPWKKDESKILQ